MQPHVALANDTIHDIALLRDGSIACVAGTDLALFDSELRPIPGTRSPGARGRIVELPDGRLAVLEKSSLRFHVGTRGEELAQVESTDDLSLFSSLIPTERGFIVPAFNGFLVDEAGTRRVVRLDGFTHYHGAVAWRGGAAMFGFEGVALVGPDGVELARTTEVSPDHPIACPDMLVGIYRMKVVVLDPELRLVATIETDVNSDDDLTPFRDGFLIRSYDEDRKCTTVGYWRREGEAVTKQWSVEKPGVLARPRVVGDRIVLVAYRANVWIYDGNGSELATIPTSNFCGAVAQLGDGIAVSERQTFGAVWWRPEGAKQTLEHDIAPEHMTSLPDGRLLTSDGAALLRWDPNQSAPARARVTPTMPLEVPLVIDGQLVRVLGPGFTGLRARTLTNQLLLVKPDAAWRQPIERDEAQRILEALAARTQDTADYEELAFVLGSTARQLKGAVRVRKTVQIPPRAIPDYEYLGSFATSGELIVADPCYLKKRAAPGFSLTHRLKGHEGLWHVFVRADREDPRRNAELVTIHEQGFDAASNELVANVGVDAGLMGVFDKACPKPDLDKSIDDGVFVGQGAIASSGYGDGMYPVFVGKAQGKVAKIRIHFIGDDGELDRTIAVKPATSATPYSPKATYKIGDAVAHPKFGSGAVVRAGNDGKVDIMFPDGTRTLVHGRK